MLWSLIKIIIFIGIVAALTLGAGILMETSGGIRIAVGNYEFNLGPLQAAIGLLVLVIAVWIILKLLGLILAILRFLTGDETAISRWRSRRHERKGFEALADGLMALASGEGRVAMSKAARAERYLKRPELTNLVTAQAAEIAGDREKAEEVYRRLLEDDRTRFVGVRGIMKQKLAEGDTDTAFKLAEKAFALKPRHEETQDVLLRMQASRGDFAGARQTLGAKLKYGYLPRDIHRRRDAVLALGEAKSIVEEGKSVEARETAIQANKLSPDLVPAAVMSAQSYIEQGQKRYAARVISKAWNVSPHPDLAAAFAAIEPDETPAARLKRFQTLTKQHASNPETRLLLAELNIAAGDYPAARKALGDLHETAPTVRSLTMMAAIERGEGASDTVVKGYLARAVNASRGPQWVCGNCHHIPGRWVPVCPNCGAFDTMAWEEPPSDQESLPPGGAMLPLIVGAQEDAVDHSDEDGDETDDPSAGDTAANGDIAQAVGDVPTEDDPAPPPPASVPAKDLAEPEVLEPQGPNLPLGEERKTG